MKERPILFSAPMVRALLDGRKTQTRRVIKPQPEMKDFGNGLMPWMPIGGVNADRWPCPYGEPGDILRVRETAWERPERTIRMMRDGADTWPPYVYDADGISEEEHAQLKAWGWKRRPSIHLPRLGSRIKLEITAIRVERLQDISEADSFAEGIPGELLHRAQGWAPGAYRFLWEQINGPDSWTENPWVWVIEFKRINDDR
jgi:hypothetical protein